MCKVCSSVESASNVLYRCDHCMTWLCSKCSKLTTTEQRAVALKSRLVIYWCTDCKTAVDDRALMGSAALSKLKESIIGAIREEISTLKGTISVSNDYSISKNDLIPEIQRTFRDADNENTQAVIAELKSLSTKVTDLKDSNVDLVRVLTKNGNHTHEGGYLDNGPGHSAQAFGSLVGKLQHQIDQLNSEVAFLRQIVDGQGSAKLAPSAVVPSSGPLSHGQVKFLPVQPKFSDQNGKSGERRSIQDKKSTASPPKVNSTRRKTDSVVGTGHLVNSKIKAAVITPKASVCVGHLSLDVNEDDIRDHLLTLFPNENFTFEKLQVKSGQYNSFRIEMKIDLVEKILDPSLWPQKVVVKRFRFFRPKKQCDENSAFQRRK